MFHYVITDMRSEHGKKFIVWIIIREKKKKCQISGRLIRRDIERPINSPRVYARSSLQLFLFITLGPSAGVFERRKTGEKMDLCPGHLKYRSKCNTPRNLLTVLPANIVFSILKPGLNCGTVEFRTSGACLHSAADHCR